MSWLARLDTRATRWPRPLRWSFVTLKWFLVANGVFLVSALAVTEIRDSRVGLGTGVLTMVLLATIKGIVMAVTASRPDEPSAH